MSCCPYDDCAGYGSSCCEECCTCGRYRAGVIAAQDDFDADELGLDPEEEYDA